MFSDGRIPPHFIRFATDILGDMEEGLSGARIVKITADYAAEYDVDIPHASVPMNVPNMRTALYENLL